MGGVALPPTQVAASTAALVYLYNHHLPGTPLDADHLLPWIAVIFPNAFGSSNSIKGVLLSHLAVL